MERNTSQTAKVYVYDMMGRVVIEDNMVKGTREFKVNLEKLVTGLYQVVVIEDKQTICTRKLRVEKY